MKLGYMVTYKVRKNPNVFGVIVSKVKVTAAKNRLKMGGRASTIQFPDDNSHILNRIGIKLGYMVTYKVRKNPIVFGVIIIVSNVKVTAAKNRLKMG